MRLLADERRRLSPLRHGRLNVAVGYPSSYHVAHSSLAFQWVVELAARVPGVGVQRFVVEPGLTGTTLETGTPLGDFDILAFSCSFELDAVNVLRTLAAAGIPTRREERGPHHPLVVLGGAVASINPLPLAPAVDVFCLGAAELVWTTLLGLALDDSDRGRLLESLAGRDGFLVPGHHLGPDGSPLQRLRRLEKRADEMNDQSLVPTSHIVTPNTEYRDRGLVEMSRGCPEKCRYCWVSYNYGRLRCYPTDAIEARVEALAEITDRIGFVATAVGDHPELARILEKCRALDLDVALSSLRIPAMTEPVLSPLAECGARSITIAPETGSDALRTRLKKPIPNSAILRAVETAQKCGIASVKMYFIIGLPGETDDDVASIGRLVSDASAIVRSHGGRRGRVGRLHAGLNLLVPKPYTPYHDAPMLERGEARRRIALVERALRDVPNATLSRPPYRESIWQGYLSRAGVAAFAALEEAAAGRPIGELLRRHAKDVARVTLRPSELGAPWHFIGSAPLRTAETT